jgi:cellulose synthase (UDP-forming)
MHMDKPTIHTGYLEKALLAINVAAGLVYFSWWFLPGHAGNPILYSLLLLGEFYHMIMAYTFWRVLWPKSKHKRLTRIPRAPDYFPNVDVFIPVAGEPLDIIRQTVEAAKGIEYPNHTVYILNDGYVAGKDNALEVEILADKLGVTCISRHIPGGAKAGNINNALQQTSAPLIAIFDSDMVPHADFLKRTVPFFANEKIGLVQTPQYYKNHDLNEVTAGSWAQQELFFGPILQGKDKDNAVFLCGTNAVLRRTALTEVGGMYEKSIAEDFLTSLLIHEKGWVSRYVPDVLVEGLAPEDLLSYYKQQYRWARGSLEVLFRMNPLFRKGLTPLQKIHYLSSALYYANGLVILIDMTTPLMYLYFNIQSVITTTSSFAVFFIPFMFLNLYTLYLASKANVTFRALSFGHASWFLQLTAIQSVLLQEQVSFAVTPKQAQTGNYLFLTYPHLAFAILSVIGWIVAINRDGLTPAVATNISWTVFNMALFLPFINAAYKQTPIPARPRTLPSPV